LKKVPEWQLNVLEEQAMLQRKEQESLGSARGCRRYRRGLRAVVPARS
jgi:hypothetical protein